MIDCCTPCPSCRPLVAIVDDDADLRRSLAFLLQELDAEIIEYPSAEAFLAHYQPQRPTCLLVDVRMPGMSGLELQALLNRDPNFTASVIFLTGHGDIPMAVDAMRAGAMVFLQKPCDDTTLLDHVADGIMKSHQSCCHQREKTLVSERMALLTPRELAVALKVVEGKANKVIAFELDLSIKTVEVHRAHAMEKLKANSIPELTKILLISGH